MVKAKAKKEEEAQKLVYKVSKSYSRKVSLKGITSRFDNIDCGTFVTAVIECEDQDDFNSKVNILGEKVRAETEKDIALAMQGIMDLAKDPENNALVGEGTSINPSQYIPIHIEGFDTLPMEQSGISEVSPDEFEEVDMEQV